MDTITNMTLSEIENLIQILHEDNHIIVIVKPRGIPSQADKSGDDDLLTLLKEYIKQKYNKQGNVYCGLVHRLDRPTGGVMVFAKTDKAAARLSEQFKNSEITKKYFAIVNGKPRDKIGRYESYLRKDERNNIVKNHVGKVENSKLAILEYKILDVVKNPAYELESPKQTKYKNLDVYEEENPEEENLLSLLDINLVTGRSHQARVQLSALGCPIYGDHKYGKSEGNQLSLWAYSLSFTHPTKQEVMSFKVFPPTEEKPWNLFPMDRHIHIARPD